MSVSIAEIKSILINSYSIMYGNIDPKYITMTRFFEKSPGEFDYTCEVLVPQTPGACVRCGPSGDQDYGNRDI